jgi:hypothetical protein
MLIGLDAVAAALFMEEIVDEVIYGVGYAVTLAIVFIVGSWFWKNVERGLTNLSKRLGNATAYATAAAYLRAGGEPPPSSSPELKAFDAMLREKAVKEKQA